MPKFKYSGRGNPPTGSRARQECAVWAGAVGGLAPAHSFFFDPLRHDA